MSNPRVRAFTLIELLVVISIISLLISILLPTLSEARETARSINCLSNLRQIGMAMEMYADANGDHYPTKRPKGVNGNSSIYMWVGKAGTLNPGPGGVNFTYGPEFRPLNEYLGSADPNSGVEVSRCPSDEVLAPLVGTSFASNTQADPNGPGLNTLKTTIYQDGYLPIKRGNVRVTTKFLLGEEAGMHYATWAADPPNDTFLANVQLDDLFWHYAFRRWNAAYADGHAATTPVEDYNAPVTDDYAFQWE